MAVHTLYDVSVFCILMLAMNAMVMLEYSEYYTHVTDLLKPAINLTNK